MSQYSSASQSADKCERIRKHIRIAVLQPVHQESVSTSASQSASTSALSQQVHLLHKVLQPVPANRRTSASASASTSASESAKVVCIARLNERIRVRSTSIAGALQPARQNPQVHLHRSAFTSASESALRASQSASNEHQSP